MLQPLTTSFSVAGNGVNSLKQIQKSYDSLKSSFKTVESQTAQSFNKMGNSANKFFNTVKRGTAKIGTGFKNFMARSDLGIGKDSAPGGISPMVGGAIGGSAVGLLRKSLAIGAVVGLTAGIGSTISEYQRFDDVMLQSKAISGATEKQYSSLREQAKELGRTTRFEAYQVAEAQKYQAIAGWKVNDILTATPAIMNLAAASAEDLGTVSDIVTDSMTAFKWEAKDATKFTDILAATATSTNTNVSQMGEAFKYVSPMASALGESVQTTATYLGMLANAGIKGSMAGTSLNQVFSSLLNPTDEVNKMLGSLNVRIKDSRGNFLGLRSVVADLRKGISGLGEYEQASVLNKIFGERGGRAILTIMKSTNKEFEDLLFKVEKSEGATKRMADIMNSGIGGALDNLKSASSGFKIELMEIMSKPFIKWLNGVSDGINEWTKNMKPNYDAMMKFWEDNKMAIIGLATYIGYVFFPLQTLGVWLVALYKNSEIFRDSVNETFGEFWKLVKHIIPFITFMIDKLIGFYDYVIKIGTAIKDSFSLLKDKEGNYRTSFGIDEQGNENSTAYNKSSEIVDTVNYNRANEVKSINNNGNKQVIMNVYGGDVDLIKQTIDNVMFEKDIKEGRL